MAINFEAANMAGYNNPKIEVFEATPDASGTSLVQYPAKSVILNCLSRGSLPIIMLCLETAGYLMPISDWDTNEIGTSISFSALSGAAPASNATKIQITYPDSGGTPTIIFE